MSVVDEASLATQRASSASVASEVSRASAQVQEYVRRSRSENTLRAYRSDWAKWQSWCRRHHVQTPLPADPVLVAEYVAEASRAVDEAGRPAYSVATLARWVAALGFMHAQAGLPKPGAHPIVANVLSGIRAARVENAPGPLKSQAKPLMLDQLRVVLGSVPTRGYPQGIIGVRDKAMLLTQWAGALRADSVRSLLMSEVSWHDDDGVHLYLRRSKTDREGKGRTIALPRGRHVLTCAPCALARWIMLVAASRGDECRPQVMAALSRVNGLSSHVCLSAPVALSDLEGPLFRRVHKSGAIGETSLGANAVNAVVVQRTRAAGLGGFTSHSLRSGFVTEASRQGLSTEMIMRQTGQSKDIVDMYRRHQNPLEANAVTELGL